MRVLLLEAAGSTICRLIVLLASSETVFNMHLISFLLRATKLE